MVYDPSTGLFGDDGGDYPSSSGNALQDFFGIPADEPGDSEDDDGVPIILPAGDVPAGEFGHVSYDRGDNQIAQRELEVGRDIEPRPRTSTQAERRAGDRWASQSRADTGNRNLRRVVGEHGTGVGEGGSGEVSMATSIEDAASQLRGSFLDSGYHTGDLDTRVDRRTTMTAGEKAARERLQRRIRKDADTMSVVPRPQLSTTLNIGEVYLEAELYTAKMNAAGDWMVTLKVPYHFKSSVDQLTTVPGLSLEARITMKGG